MSQVPTSTQLNKSEMEIALKLAETNAAKYMTLYKKAQSEIAMYKMALDIKQAAKCKYWMED